MNGYVDEKSLMAKGRVSYMNGDGGYARRVRHGCSSDDGDDGDVMMIWKWWERNCRKYAFGQSR